MTSHLVVSTECPLCGAPLDFTEGSNAVQCLHCQSNLLVTGRKQLLSYYVAPKTDAHRAMSRLTAAQLQRDTVFQFVKSQLYFIPYYRLTGHDFRWELAPEKPKVQRSTAPLLTPMGAGGTSGWEDSSLDLSSFVEGAGNLIGKLFGVTVRTGHGSREDTAPMAIQEKPSRHRAPFSSRESSAPTVRAPRGNGHHGLRIFNQYVEKNFVGCNLDGVGLYSLGVRPSVLRLELFRREVLQSLGKIVQANISPSAALLHGMRAGRSEPISYRKVIGRILSLIYFPFWVLELKQGAETRLAIIDAVSQSVITLDAPPSLYQVLEQEVQSDPDTIGFRPLTCPNCGWDLPILPENVIFFCSSCERTWQILGNGLYEVPYRIAQWANSENHKPVRYLPFWVLETHGENDQPSKWFVPAFRYRQLKFLGELAMGFSREQPSYSIVKETIPQVGGCFYDKEDAAMLAQFSQVGLAPKPLERIKTFQQDELPVHSATLTWFPFEIHGNYLIDPVSRRRLTQSLLL